MNVSSVLDGAADLIERDGWCGRHCKESVYCAANAISLACGESTLWRDKLAAWDALRLAIGDDLSVASNWGIWNWNDAPGRTKKEVIAMLRAVAATERAREASPVRVVAETQGALPESVSDICVQTSDYS